MSSEEPEKARSSDGQRQTPAGHSAVRQDLPPRHPADESTRVHTGESRPTGNTAMNSPNPQTSPPDPAQTLSPKKPQRKAHSLIDKVYNGKNLWTAWRKVRANKGAHGLDRVTIRMFERNVEMHLREIQRKLMQRRFQPQPVRRVYIPKAGDKSKLRPLGIPVVADRIVQQAIVQVVEPLFDAQMSPRSFGFRKHRRAHAAIATVIQDAKEGYREVVDADIASFFDKIDHAVVMSRVRARIADGRVLDLIEDFLKAGVSEHDVITVPTEGTPQGGVISPWLSNLVLDDLDKAIEAKGWRHVRYADDFVVLCKSREEAECALDYVKVVLGKLKLSLHETKTRLSDFREGFDFLGFRFHNFCLGIRPKTLERFKDRVRQLTRRQQGRNVEAVLRDLNPVLRGWSNYVGVAEVTALFDVLDGWIRSRLRAFKQQRWSHNDRWRIPNRRLRSWGLLSLRECRAELRLSFRLGSLASERMAGPLLRGTHPGSPSALTAHAAQ